MENVLITGLGAVTCHGGGRHALWSAMSGAAARAPDAVPDARGRMDLPLMHLVPDTDIPAAPQRLADAPLGRAPRMAVAAAREALADAGLEEGSSQPAVVIGTTMGDQGQREADGEPGTPVFLVASALGDALGLAGGHTSVSNACAASGYAISIAADMIRCGEADVVLAGGADAYSRVALACFNRMRAVDPVRCRPFDMHRSGTVFGEGAAMLVLESQTHARARGARAYARLAG
ncbi:MAG: beta-ketoacyl-[acyl-carrier-protein] synthase family protein, partial [Actinomadura rubrobrunea]|nr:beta-ketoacyl-[acyl-carrier-protein] synthase family protein [Actinomadura rubrobrunea]